MKKPPSNTHLESIMIENTSLTCRHSLWNIAKYVRLSKVMSGGKGE